MSDVKQYIKKIKLVNGDIKYIRDEEAVHTDELETALADYLPLTGGDITGDVNISGSLSAATISLGDIPELTTPVSNVLTKDDDDNDKLKYHSTANFLEEIGGIGQVTVDNNNTVIYGLGKYNNA